MSKPQFCLRNRPKKASSSNVSLSWVATPPKIGSIHVSIGGTFARESWQQFHKNPQWEIKFRSVSSELLRVGGLPRLTLAPVLLYRSFELINITIGELRWVLDIHFSLDTVTNWVKEFQYFNKFFFSADISTHSLGKYIHRRSRVHYSKTNLKV